MELEAQQVYDEECQRQKQQAQAAEIAKLRWQIARGHTALETPQHDIVSVVSYVCCQVLCLSHVVSYTTLCVCVVRELKLTVPFSHSFLSFPSDQNHNTDSI
jgi:hypothetical protein